MRRVAHTRPARAGGRSGESGETLPEVLVAVVLMGVGFTALLTGIFASVRIADANSQRSQASVAVQVWAEQLLQPALPSPTPADPSKVPQIDYTTYIACATPADYQNLVAPSAVLPKGWTATVTDIRYLKAAVASGGKPTWTPSHAQCTGSAEYGTLLTVIDANGVSHQYHRDRGLQELTIEIDSGAGGKSRYTDTLVLVKRDPRCPGSYDNADLGPC